MLDFKSFSDYTWQSLELILKHHCSVARYRILHPHCYTIKYQCVLLLCTSVQLLVVVEHWWLSLLMSTF